MIMIVVAVSVIRSFSASFSSLFLYLVTVFNKLLLSAKHYFVFFVLGAKRGWKHFVDQLPLSSGFLSNETNFQMHLIDKFLIWDTLHTFSAFRFRYASMKLCRYWHYTLTLGLPVGGRGGGVLLPLFPSKIALCSHVPTRFTLFVPLYYTFAYHLSPPSIPSRKKGAQNKGYKRRESIVCDVQFMWNIISSIWAKFTIR